MPAPTYRQAANGWFYAHWSVGRRSFRKSLGTQSESEARLRFAQWLLVEEAAPELDTVTVGELWAVYFERHIQAKTVAVRAAEYRWKNLEPHFGRLLLAQVTQEVVDAYERKRIAGKIGEKCLPGTVRGELSYIRSCLNWCAHPRRKIIKKLDVPDFAMPDNHEPRDRWLKVPEIQRLLASARALRNDRKNQEPRLSRGERFLWLALETAARKRAIEELTWDRVDFETGVIHYNVPGRRATKKRRGSPPISTALRPVLERAYAERRGNYVLDQPTDISRVVENIAAHAGLPDVTPHVLRHTAATLMARRGVPITTIADVLANSVAVCERVYRHHCPDASRAAVEHISAGLLEAAE
jgi:integrase